MKIKMLTSFAGGWSCAAGDVIERPDAEARRLVDAGFAEFIREEPKEIALAKRPLEKASK